MNETNTTPRGNIKTTTVIFFVRLFIFTPLYVKKKRARIEICTKRVIRKKKRANVYEKNAICDICIHMYIVKALFVPHLNLIVRSIFCYIHFSSMCQKKNVYLKAYEKDMFLKESAHIEYLT